MSEAGCTDSSGVLGDETRSGRCWPGAAFRHFGIPAQELVKVAAHGITEAIAVSRGQFLDLAFYAIEQTLHVQRFCMSIHLLATDEGISFVGFSRHVRKDIVEDFPIEPPVEELPAHP